MNGVVFIIKYKDGIILQKRTSDYVKFPNQWTIMGGGQEDNETLKKAANREVKEELGLNINLKHIGEFEFKCKKNSIGETLHAFSGRIDDLSKISLGEGVGFAVFTKNELHKIENKNMQNLIKEIMKW